MTGLEKLTQAVENDKKSAGNFHDYDGKLKWVIDRAKQYARLLGVPYEEVINAWESQRDYWYMNFYQDCNQPDLSTTKVLVYDTPQAFAQDTKQDGFRCPYCHGVSHHPQKCDSGLVVALINKKRDVCNWASYGLFGTLGKGTYVLFRDSKTVHPIFMPIKEEKGEQNGKNV